MGKGIIVEYINGKNEKQRGHVFPDDQKPSFANLNKVFIRLVDADGNRKIDSITKKEMSAFKELKDLTQIGYID